MEKYVQCASKDDTICRAVPVYFNAIFRSVSEGTYDDIHDLFATLTQNLMNRALAFGTYHATWVAISSAA